MRCELSALLWPTACVACGLPDRECCDACIGELRGSRGPFRSMHLEGDLPVFACGAYAGALRAVLVAFKHGGGYGFARDLAECLGSPLGAALREASAEGATPPVLVPIPSRRARVRERGYRHVEVLLRRALRGSEARMLTRALAPRRGRRGQVGLGPAGRRRNARLIAVPARASQRLAGRRVVIVDDVVTTGATVLAAREALEAAGANVVAVVCLCVTDRRSLAEGAGRTTRAEVNRVETPGTGAVEFDKGVSVRHTGPPA